MSRAIDPMRGELGSPIVNTSIPFVSNELNKRRRSSPANNDALPIETNKVAFHAPVQVQDTKTDTAKPASKKPKSTRVRTTKRIYPLKKEYNQELAQRSPFKKKLLDARDYLAKKFVSIEPIQRFILFTDPVLQWMDKFTGSLSVFKIPKGLKPEEVVVKPIRLLRKDPITKEEYILNAVFLRPSHNLDAEKTVVIGHGRNSSFNEFGKSISNLVKAGHNVFISSYSGFASNGGTITRRALVEDFKAMLDMAHKLSNINKLPGDPQNKLSVLIHSLGGGIGAQALDEHDMVIRELLLGSPFTSLRDVSTDLPKHPVYQDSFYHRNVLKLMGWGLGITMDARSEQNRKLAIKLIDKKIAEAPNENKKRLLGSLKDSFTHIVISKEPHEVEKRFNILLNRLDSAEEKQDIRYIKELYVDDYNWRTLHHAKNILDKGKITDEVRVIGGRRDYWVPTQQHMKAYNQLKEIIGLIRSLQEGGQEDSVEGFLNVPIPKITLDYDNEAGHTDKVLWSADAGQ